MLMLSFHFWVLLRCCYAASLMNNSSWAIKLGILNFLALSVLIVLILSPNCAFIRAKKDWTRFLISFLDFIRNTQVHLVWSSIIVKKYLKPSRVGVGIGPQTSQWIKEKATESILLCVGKDNRFCLANGQTVQWFEWSWILQMEEPIETKSVINCKFEYEVCPSLKCHKSIETSKYTCMCKFILEFLSYIYIYIQMHMHTWKEKIMSFKLSMSNKCSGLCQTELTLSQTKGRTGC